MLNTITKSQYRGLPRPCEIQSKLLLSNQLIQDKLHSQITRLQLLHHLTRLHIQILYNLLRVVKALDRVRHVFDNMFLECMILGFELEDVHDLVVVRGAVTDGVDDGEGEFALRQIFAIAFC